MTKPQIQVPRPVLVVQDENAKRRRWISWCIFVPIFAILFVGLGYGLANRQQVLAYVKGEETLRSQVRLLEQELKEAQHELALHRTAVEVSQQAQNSVRKELRNYHERAAELEETLAFYQRIMNPAGAEQGLRADAVFIKEEEAAHHYAITIMLGQFGGEHESVRGRLAFDVLGEQEGEAVVLPHEEVLVENTDLAFSLRYYQEKQVLVQLPEGFEPQAVKVKLTPTGNQVKPSENQFEWLVKEL